MTFSRIWESALKATRISPLCTASPHTAHKLGLEAFRVMRLAQTPFPPNQPTSLPLRQNTSLTPTKKCLCLCICLPPGKNMWGAEKLSKT